MAKAARDASGRLIEETSGQVHENARSGGGKFATILSAFALLFSGYSFYETVLRAPELAIYVPPRIDYTDPDRPDSPYEVFIVPLTLANDGARSGTILSMDLDVTNPRTGQTKRFYGAYVGSYGNKPVKPLTPVALSGKASFSQAVQFIPRVGEKIPRILDFEAGDYRFEIRLNTATTGSDLPFLAPVVKPLRFNMQIGKLNYLFFNGTGTMPMWSKDYRPAKSGDN